MKCVIFALLAIVVICSIANAKYSGGSGEPNTPYQIADVNDLLTLANDVNDYNKCFIMTADVNLDPNLPGNQVFTTAVIARDVNNANYKFDGNSFAGVFDGAGHQISNITIDTNGVGNDYLGLFGRIDIGGEVKNLRLENIRLTGGSYSYYFGGLAGDTLGNISNSFSTGVVAGGEYTSVLGGLVGYCIYGIISNCSSTINVVGGNNSGSLGGLVGGTGPAGAISDCFATGQVTGGVYPMGLGGLAGSNSGSITDSYSTGTVTGTAGAWYLGGLVGDNYQGNITYCYSTSAVVSGDDSYGLGGLVGENDEGDIGNSFSTGAVTGGIGLMYLGGLVGENSFGITSNSYSSGITTAGSGSVFLGGLVGRNVGPLLKCYFLDIAGPNNGYGTPLTDTQMKQQASFVGWSFNNVWTICEGISYPKLAWQFVVGDSDNDKDVDFTDFALMGNKWLLADSTLYCGGTDLTGDQWVDLDDLAILCDNWLLGL
jgi:hypothetical protein